MSDTAVAEPEATVEKRERTVQPFASRLARAVEHSDKQMQSFRDNRTKIIREYVGRWYGTRTDERQQPLNMLFNVVATLLPALTLTVRSRITTKRMELRDFARRFEQDVNDAMVEIELNETFRQCVFDAIFALGVTKTGLGMSYELPGETGETGNVLSDPGEVFCDVVDLDNFIPDMTARKGSEMAHVGDRFWVPYDWAMDQRDMFNRDRLERLQLNERDRQQHESGRVGQEGRVPDDAYLIDRVQLCDVWVPSKRAVFTIPGDPRQSVGFIREVGWDGPELGPYGLVGLARVPGNLLAVPLLGIIYDLYEAMNTTGRKMIRRMGNKKDVLAVAEGREKDGQAIRTANDGDVVTVKDTNLLKMMTFGGAPEDGMKSVDWLYNFFNRISGNMDLVAGAGPQAGTLGQDQMNVANARLRLADWERGIREAAKALVKQIAWYEWNDPVTKRDLVIQVPGLGALEREWGPTLRKGEFPNYLIDVDPYGQYAGGPTEQAAKKREFIQTVVIPLEPAARAQGLTIDVRRITDDLAGDMGIEDGAGFFTEVQQQPALGMGGQVGGVSTSVSHDTTINAGGRGPTQANTNTGAGRPPAPEPPPQVPAQQGE